VNLKAMTHNCKTVHTPKKRIDDTRAVASSYKPGFVSKLESNDAQLLRLYRQKYSLASQVKRNL